MLTFTLTSFTTRDAYTIFQGTVIRPAGGESFERLNFGVKLGTAQASAKVENDKFKFCGTDVSLNC